MVKPGEERMSNLFRELERVTRHRNLSAQADMDLISGRGVFHDYVQRQAPSSHRRGAFQTDSARTVGVSWAGTLKLCKNIETEERNLSSNTMSLKCHRLPHSARQQ